MDYICLHMDKFIKVDGQKLKRLRKERALSQQDLERLSRVAQHTISILESGKREARPSTIRKLAAAMNIEPKRIMQD